MRRRNMLALAGLAAGAMLDHGASVLPATTTGATKRLINFPEARA